MWYAIAAVISATVAVFSSLGAVWLTQRYNERSEKQRLDADASNRAAERREAIRARLHEDRLEAYRQFIGAYQATVRMKDRVGRTWGTRQWRTKQLMDARVGSPEHKDAVLTIDTANAEFNEACIEAHQADLELEDALLLLELVASGPVGTAARDLLSKLRDESRALVELNTNLDDRGPAGWQAYQEISERSVTARIALQDAIRRELQLDE